MTIIVSTTTGAKAINVYKDDKGAAAILNFKSYDEEGSALVLTGYTITLNVVTDDDSSDGSTFSFTGACSIVSAADGTFSYTPAATDFSATGSYLAHIIFTKTGEQAFVKFGSIKVIATPLTS